MHEQWAQLGAEYEKVHQTLKKRARLVARAARVVEPAGAAEPDLFERLRILKAQREAAHVE
jgi:hypothetical protein